MRGLLKSSVCIVLSLVAVRTASADAFLDALRAAGYRADTSSGGVSLIGERSEVTSNVTPRAQVFAPATASPAAPSAQPRQTRLSVPPENRPWMLHWFPYAECHLAFWRSGYDPKLSPLEKYDNMVRQLGMNEPYAAAFEATDGRPWVASASGLKPGHNVAQAVTENGNNRETVPWWNWDGREWKRSVTDVSWWGHCNGWAAASVSFKESKLDQKTVNLDRRHLLERPRFDTAANAYLPREGQQPTKVTLDQLYRSSGGGPMILYPSDLKAMLVEYGMQLRPNPEYTAGSRYDAPVQDIDERLFERLPDGKVKIPTDASYLWLVVKTPKGNYAHYVQQGYPNDVLHDWKDRVIAYYRHYLGATVTASFTARFANLPADPTVEQLETLPVPVRKSYLDLAPEEFKQKLFGTVGEGGHGLIVEIIAGSQVWNYPVIDCNDQASEVRMASYRAQNDVVRMFNLSRQDPQVLTWIDGQPYIRYREGTLRVSYQRPAPHREDSGSQPTTVLPATYNYYSFVDSQNRVLSSTWRGDSVKTHPDFCWYPDLDAGGDPNISNPYVKAAALNRIIPGLSLR